MTSKLTRKGEPQLKPLKPFASWSVLMSMCGTYVGHMKAEIKESWCERWVRRKSVQSCTHPPLLRWYRAMKNWNSVIFPGKKNRTEKTFRLMWWKIAVRRNILASGMKWKVPLLHSVGQAWHHFLVPRWLRKIAAEYQRMPPMKCLACSPNQIIAGAMQHAHEWSLLPSISQVGKWYWMGPLRWKAW